MTSELFTHSRGTGPALVLLHGWGLNSGVWEPIIERLQDCYRVTTVDLPGFGRNADALAEPYSLDNLAHMIAAHLPQNCTLLGWSMGGLVAQRLATLYPERLDKLILVASSPRFLEGPNWPGMRDAILNTFEVQLERDFSKTLDRFLAIQAMGSPSARQDIKQIRHHVQQFPLPSVTALKAGLSLLSESDLRMEASQTQIPTERIYGRLDSLVPHQVIDKISALQPRSRAHIFAHASHAPFISHADEFVRLLESFCQKG